MDKTKKNYTNDCFLNRFSNAYGSLDGVAVNSDNENNLAVGSENEQKADNNITDVRNTSVDSDNRHEVMELPDSAKPKKADEKVLWSFLDIDDRIQFDIEGVKNTARELFTNELLKSWEDQANELSEKYPDFDIRREVKNKSFLAMLRCGIPLDLAYKALNYDAVLKSEVNKALDLFYADLKIRGSRPSENGLISGGGINIGLGARSFSKKERADIARRVEKGEKVYL